MTSRAVLPRLARLAARASNTHLRALASVSALGMALAHCKSNPSSGESSKTSRSSPQTASAAPAPALSGPAASAPAATASAADEHAEHDCRTAHPVERPKVSTATALTKEARRNLTALRISAHVGAVILRKQDSGWVVAGYDCALPASRVERALDNLERLKAVRTEEPIPSGAGLDLQIVAQIGEERVLYLEVAKRDARGDLAQLFDDSRVRIQGLDRELLSTNPRAWCEGL
jgi:hypothetical protein